MSDQSSKLLNIATRGVDAAERLVNALTDLQNAGKEYVATGTSFTDALFTNSDLKHLDAYTIGALLANVTNDLTTTFNVPLNHDILLKVRK